MMFDARAIEFPNTPAGCDRLDGECTTPGSEIDLGLAVLAAVSPSAVSFSQEDIAEVCGCDKGTIHRLEARALRKLRSHPDRRLLRELLDEVKARSIRTGNPLFTLQL